MKKKCVIFLTILVMTGCRQIETITTKTTTRIDSVQVSVPIDRHVMDEVFTWSDSIYFEDDKIRVIIVTDSVTNLPEDVTNLGQPVSLISDSGTVTRRAPTYRLIAEVKPDTAEVKVAEKTITTETEHIKYRKQMPGWGWLVIGGLLAIALILLVAMKIRRG